MAEVLKLNRAFTVIADEDTLDSPDVEKDQMIVQCLLNRMQAVSDETTSPQDSDGDTFP